MRGPPHPHFIDAATFGAQADACAKYLTKGRAVAVTGRLVYRDAATLRARPSHRQPITRPASSAESAPLVSPLRLCLPVLVLSFDFERLDGGAANNGPSPQAATFLEGTRLTPTRRRRSREHAAPDDPTASAPASPTTSLIWDEHQPVREAEPHDGRPQRRRRIVDLQPPDQV